MDPISQASFESLKLPLLIFYNNRVLNDKVKGGCYYSDDPTENYQLNLSLSALW